LQQYRVTSMRATSLLTISAALMLSTAALAQSSPASSHGPGTTTARRPPAANPLRQADVSKIEGMRVLGDDGKLVGDISNVLMRPQDRKIDRLVVHTGGVLGIGGRYVAMPIAAFSWDAGKDAFTIAKTANDVKYMADWKPAASETTETGTSEPSGRAAIPPSSAGK
jgi:sporulation protein YlmC with PRC-barrel domain